MKRILLIPSFLVVTSVLMSHPGTPGMPDHGAGDTTQVEADTLDSVADTLGRQTADSTHAVSDSTHAVSDSTHAVSDTTEHYADSAWGGRDPSASVHDTLREVEVRSDKETPLERAINESLRRNRPTKRPPNISDIIGEKATDYIMNPTAWKERRKEKNLKRTRRALDTYDSVKTYEQELAEAIERQLREDSIAEAQEKERERGRR